MLGVRERFPAFLGTSGGLNANSHLITWTLNQLGREAIGPKLEEGDLIRIFSTPYISHDNVPEPPFPKLHAVSSCKRTSLLRLCWTFPSRSRSRPAISSPGNTSQNLKSETDAKLRASLLICGGSALVRLFAWENRNAQFRFDTFPHDSALSEN